MKDSVWSYFAFVIGFMWICMWRDSSLRTCLKRDISGHHFLLQERTVYLSLVYFIMCESRIALHCTHFAKHTHDESTNISKVSHTVPMIANLTILMRSLLLLPLLVQVLYINWFPRKFRAKTLRWLQATPKEEIEPLILTLYNKSHYRIRTLLNTYVLRPSMTAYTVHDHHS